VVDKRIKANSASTGICQYDAYVGGTIVSRTGHNVEFAQGKTITSIVGIQFVKNVAGCASGWGRQEFSHRKGSIAHHAG
jgi:hypothetical protein